MAFDLEQIKAHIPYYLTSDDSAALVAELKAVLSGSIPNFYLSGSRAAEHEANILQGDGWPGFELFLFDSGTRIPVRGIVLSNSCDVDANNKRDVPSRIVFAPIIKLAAYKALLDSSGIDRDRVESKIDAIKSQKATSIFYLPSGGPIAEEYLVRLDDVHSMPVSAFKTQGKLFSLSMVGFYLFLLKLSIHFCRFQEKVDRKNS